MYGDVLSRAEQYRAAGQLQEAEALCRQALAADPEGAEATHLLGVIVHQSGKLPEALALLRRAVALAPEVALYQANLAETCRLAGRVGEAIEHGRRALALKPAYPEALSNLGIAHYERGDYAEAAAHHREAVSINPTFPEAHSNLGNALFALRRFDEAVAAYRRAIELRPDFAHAWSNLGTALHHAGDYEEAMAALRRAMALDRDHANARSGLGILLLMRGDFAEGWEEYEWRLRSSAVKGPRFPQNPWQGESLAGRRLYVQAEQGFGDTLHFARYLPLLAKRAGAVSFRVHQPLLTLLRESLPGIEVLGDRGESAMPTDCDCALLSLPYLLRTRLETIPADLPYLHPPASLMARWRGRLGAMTGLKIGIVWAGNPEHTNDGRRSLAVELLRPLMARKGVSFASLQVGPRAGDIRAAADATVIDLSGELVDFAETAAAVAALDLVISVDTAVAHLAGGLAKPTWLLLPWVTDWRWLLEREDSPWYPTMRLFRQRRGEAWAEVIGRLGAELDKAARGETAALSPFRDVGERRASRAAAIIAIEQIRATARAAPIPEQTLTPAQALVAAEQQRRAGYLGRAEDLCRQILSAEPANAAALHLLAIIAHQSGRLAEAIQHLARAVEVGPDIALYRANLGEMCRLAGRREDAALHGRRAVALDPAYPEAHSNLGIALYELERYDEALQCYDAALALRPDYAEALSNRGNALRALKRLPEAENAYRQALALRPSFAAGWNNLGTTLRDLKRPEEAEQAYRKALAEVPNDPDTLDNLALVASDLRRAEEAEALLRRALAIDAQSEKLHVHLASVLLDQEKTPEADLTAERALALNPRSHDALALRGRAAFERGAAAESLDHYRRALALRPDLADAYNNMGNALKELGKLAAAKEAYLKAIEIDPKMTGAYANLADSQKFAADDRHLAAMEALAAAMPSLGAAEQTQLHFALGKAYADLGDHHRSFEHLLQGNALKRGMIAYDEAAALQLFDRIEAVFSVELMATRAGQGDPSALPVFVLGMPRSGTTLIEQILASHPKVHGAGELKLFEQSAQEVGGSYPEFMAALAPERLREIGARYVARLRLLAPGAEHVTDKMPSNYYFAGLISLALPKARIIHALRDPVDTCVSCFSKLFTAEQNHTYDLAELGRYYRRYEKLMAHWRRVLPPGVILELRYEDVVADLEGNARRIIAHCGLDWDDRCLDFHRTERLVRTASATQVRQPLYKSAVGRWRVYEPFLGPLLRELGVGARALTRPFC